MKESNFKNDKRLEELFAKWLDDNFYEELSKNEEILGWYRVNGEKLQKKGMDVVVVTNFGERIIDEKAALQYINIGIKTFAFEVKNQKSGAIGWLYNDSLMTEYYLLAWPNSSKKDTEVVNISDSKDFGDCEIILIKKESVVSLLEERGITKKFVEEKINELSGSATRENNKFNLYAGISLNFNFTLQEKPINIVINKELLSKKASYKGIVKGFFDEICPKCGKKNLEFRKGKNGYFIGCVDFPMCRYTRSIINEEIFD